MKNNILIIVIVTVIAIGVIAAVIIAGFVKDSENSNGSDSVPDWGGSSGVSMSTTNSDAESSVDSSLSSGTPQSTASSTQSSAVSSTASSTASSSAEKPPVTDSEFSAAGSIVATANSLIGTPFVYGGQTPDGFDSSGFIYYVLRENGFHNCPRSIAKQAAMGRQLTFDELKPGDLVLFYNDYSATPAFGGIYIGDGKMVASLTPPNREHGVMAADITTLYYQKRFFCGVSLS